MTKKNDDDLKPKKLGRPTALTPELQDEICNAIATSSKGLHSLCKIKDHWPHERNIRRAIRENESFRHKYVTAKLDQADFLAEECMEIADNIVLDSVTDDKGNERANAEWIQRSRLRVDTRKWYCSKLVPKVYGDRLNIENESENKQPIVNIQSDAIKDAINNVIKKSKAKEKK